LADFVRAAREQGAEQGDSEQLADNRHHAENFGNPAPEQPTN
jgi:hypothetical protein